jgi:hypothetical protein
VDFETMNFWKSYKARMNSDKIRYHFILTKMTDDDSVGGDVKKLKPLQSVGGDVKLCRSIGKWPRSFYCIHTEFPYELVFYSLVYLTT